MEYCCRSGVHAKNLILLTRRFFQPLVEIPSPLITTRAIFCAGRSWPMPDSADPRISWNLLEVCTGPFTANYPAKNDLYGRLFIYLRETLLGFCRQLSKQEVKIRVLSIDPLSLPGYLKRQPGDPGFDRIEVISSSEPLPSPTFYFRVQVCFEDNANST